MLEGLVGVSVHGSLSSLNARNVTERIITSALVVIANYNKDLLCEYA